MPEAGVQPPACPARGRARPGRGGSASRRLTATPRAAAAGSRSGLGLAAAPSPLSSSPSCLLSLRGGGGGGKCSPAALCSGSGFPVSGAGGRRGCFVTSRGSPCAPSAAAACGEPPAPPRLPPPRRGCPFQPFFPHGAASPLRSGALPSAGTGAPQGPGARRGAACSGEVERDPPTSERLPEKKPGLIAAPLPAAALLPAQRGWGALGNCQLPFCPPTHQGDGSPLPLLASYHPKLAGTP